MITFQPDLPSHLKERRLIEELASAQKKLKEYEDLFSVLYHNACEHCKACFQRITRTGASHASKSGLPASAVATLSSISDCNYSPNVSRSPIIKPPPISPPGHSIAQHGATISRIYAPKALSCHLGGGGASRHGLPTISNEPADPKGSTAPTLDKPTQAQYSVKFQVRNPKLKVVRVLTLEIGGHYASVVKFSPDGKYLAVGLTESPYHFQKTNIYDMITGRKICLADPYSLERSHSIYLSFSPGDGRFLATAHWSGDTMIWEVGKKRIRNAFSCPGIDTRADFSPDGRSVVIGSLNGISGVRIRSMRDGSSICLCHHDGIVAVKFSPDGKLVVASDFYGMLRLWNVRTSKMVGEWKAHQDAVFGVAFTPNGRGLVTSCMDQTLKYWDLGLPGLGGLREITEVSKFIGHIGSVCSFAISPNGRWLVSGLGDYDTASIWDMIDFSPQCALGGQSVVRSVDFCPTSDYVVCATLDYKVSVWRYYESSIAQ